MAKVLKCRITKGAVTSDIFGRLPYKRRPSLESEERKATASGYSSAIYHHTKRNQGHSFKLEATDILDREPRWYERGVKEAIYERIYNPTLNRKGGLRIELSSTWDPALPQPKGQ
ncbi:hypothetical protein Bbelb_371300 [Branchiostoma belcheri]|nr:hypothetical protein Bbelb_371300 [Branchiostoma belcheri]